MFSKAIALLVLAASAIAGPLAEGTYRITARVDFAGGQIYVSSARARPPTSELWTLKNAQDDGYTIENVNLNILRMLDSFAAVFQPQFNGAPVVTNRDPTVFNIESAGGGAFVIKIQNEDLVWNVEPPVVPTGAVTVRPSRGTNVQKWIFTPVED